AVDGAELGVLRRHGLDAPAKDGAREQEGQRGRDGRADDDDDRAADDAEQRARAEGEDGGGKEDADDAVAERVDDVAERAEVRDPGLELTKPSHDRWPFAVG